MQKSWRNAPSILKMSSVDNLMHAMTCTRPATKSGIKLDFIWYKDHLVNGCWIIVLHASDRVYNEVVLTGVKNFPDKVYTRDGHLKR